MEQIKIYRYHREDGGVTISLNEPDCEYTTLIRLVAAEGYELTNGTIKQSCIDVENPEGWYEIPEENTLPV